MPEQPEQPEHSSRFRAGDIQMRAMSSFASLDDLTVYVEYLLSRFDEQAAQLKAKVALYKKLGPDLRARALRELRDNAKELKTGVIRHGLEPSAFPGFQTRRLTHELFGMSLPVSQSLLHCMSITVALCCTGCFQQQGVRPQPRTW